MHRNRKLASILVACAIPLGTVGVFALSSPAWARVTSHHKAGAAKGTLSCTGSAGSVTFDPPLVPSGKGEKEKKVDVTVSTLGTCTSGGSPVTVTGATAKVKIASTSENLCSDFASGATSDQLSLKVTYSSASPTTIAFGADSISVTTTPLGFEASGGKAKGSYASSDATFTVPLTSSSASQIDTCLGGSGASVSSLQFQGGAATF